MSLFDHIPELPPDPILGLPLLFKDDPRTHKVNLGVGAYQTEEGKPFVFSAVRDAEALLLKKNLDKEYLPIDGDPVFLDLVQELIIARSNFRTADVMLRAQTLGGAGALRILGGLCKKFLVPVVYLPEPTWPNHAQIFSECGMEVVGYPYFDRTNKAIPFNQLIGVLGGAKKGSLILFHASCHNPTGTDFSDDQWNKLADIVEGRGLLPLFDAAYQGFGTSLHDDVSAVRLFISRSITCAVAYSCSKNFGLYGERVGALMLYTGDPHVERAVASQIRFLIRSSYSNPPLHGSRIVKEILRDPSLRAVWETELDAVRERIFAMRKMLFERLSVEGGVECPEILAQRGLFCDLGLSPEQVERLRSDWGIYLPKNGRLNVAGLTTSKMGDVVRGLLSVLNS